MSWVLAFISLSFNGAGGIFLIITPGAKAVALGSAFTSICDDATACYYNPGSIALFEKASISSMNSCPPPGMAKWLLDRLRNYTKTSILFRAYIPEEPGWLPGLYPGMKYYYWGGVLPFRENEAFGLSYTYLSTGETVVVDDEGNEIYWTTYDYDISFTYARKIAKGIGAGVSMKYIHSFLAPSEIIEEILGPEYKFGGSGRAVAFDFGVFAKSLIPGVNLGISIQNIGTEIKYAEVGTSDPLPRLIRNGVSFSLTTAFDAITDNFEFGVPIQLSDLFDWTVTGDWTTDLLGWPLETWKSRGTELTFLNFISYRIGHFEDREGHRVGNTEGYGLKIGALELDIATDSDIYGFPTESWRVQVNLKENEKPELAIRYEWIDNSLRFLSCFLLPGGGQFYNNEPIKGMPVIALGSYLGHLYFEKRDFLPAIWLGALYLGATVEAFYNL